MLIFDPMEQLLACFAIFICVVILRFACAPYYRFLDYEADKRRKEYQAVETRQILMSVNRNEAKLLKNKIPHITDGDGNYGLTVNHYQDRKNNEQLETYYSKRKTV